MLQMLLNAYEMFMLLQPRRLRLYSFSLLVNKKISDQDGLVLPRESLDQRHGPVDEPAIHRTQRQE